MKHILFIPLFALLISCTTTKPTVSSVNIVKVLSDVEKDVIYQVVEISVISPKDTLNVHELRLYEIESSLDAAFMMDNVYGSHDENIPGKYQDNIDQKLWKNVALNDVLRHFTIITDGTETMTSYFTSFVIFDANDQDCLNPNYKNQEEIINVILERMKNMIN